MISIWPIWVIHGLTEWVYVPPATPMVFSDILKDYMDVVRPLLSTYHSLSFVQKFERQLIESIRNNDAQYLDQEQEVPITASILREHCRIGKKVASIIDAIK